LTPQATRTTQPPIDFDQGFEASLGSYFLPVYILVICCFLRYADSYFYRPFTLQKTVSRCLLVLSSSGSGSGYNAEGDRPSTWSTAPAGRPGASFENPLVDSYVSANPNAEQLYILDLSQGIIQTTVVGAREYRSIGLAVLDGYGNRVTDFDDELVATLQRYAEDDAENAYFFQNDEVWGLLDMRTAIAESSSDETIYYVM
jgi:hypothetical protein